MAWQIFKRKKRLGKLRATQEMQRTEFEEMEREKVATNEKPTI
jgi:hypothetical protein